MTLSQAMGASLCVLLTTLLPRHRASRCRAAEKTKLSRETTAALKDFPLPLFVGPMLFFRLYRTPLRSLSHGMGHPSARRNRSELRNQLVRQRRTLNSDIPVKSDRFLKRPLFYCSPDFLAAAMVCSYRGHAR